MLRTVRKTEVTVNKFNGFVDGKPQVEQKTYVLTNLKKTDKEDVEKALKRELGAAEFSRLDIVKIVQGEEKTYYLSDVDFFKYATEVKQEKTGGKN